MKDAFPEDTDPNEFSDLEIVFEFQTSDVDASSLLKQTFPDQEILESNAFTGLELLSVIVLATPTIVQRLLRFYLQYQDRFKTASVKIGPEEIALSGYSMKEVEAFLKSDEIQVALQALKNREKL